MTNNIEDYGKTFAERLAYAMRLRNMKAVDVSNKTGLSRPLISQYLSGKFEAKNDNAYLLGKALDVNPLWLMGLSEDIGTSVPKKKKIFGIRNIFRYRLICCGNGGFVDDNIIDTISLPAELFNPHKEYFAQTADGDSMINAGIEPGDILVFEKTNVLDNGDIGCFCVDENEAMCKRFQKLEDGRIRLMPANDKYDPVYVDPSMEHFRIIGKLVVNIANMKGR